MKTSLNKLPAEDLRQIADFFEVVKAYKKMRKLQDENEQ